MKFESINSEKFKSFEKAEVANLNAIFGGFLQDTDENVASGDDCVESTRGEVTDEGHCALTGPGAGGT